MNTFLIGKWNVNIWKTHGFTFLFHYEWKWNDGTQKRLYILWWEINFDCTPPEEYNYDYLNDNYEDEDGETRIQNQIIKNVKKHKTIF